MSVYIIAQVSIHDRAEYDKYAAGFLDVFARFKGELLVVSENPVVIDGHWPYTRTILMRFPSAKEARRWSESPEYAAAELADLSFDAQNVEVVGGHAGPAYGVPHAATIDAVTLAGRLESLVLDPVYSGKGMAGLIALVRQGRWTRDDHVIFVHTGGAPAFFAYLDACDF